MLGNEPGDRECEVDLIEVSNSRAIESAFIISPKYPELYEAMNAMLSQDDQFFNFMLDDMVTKQANKFNLCKHKFLEHLTPEVSYSFWAKGV